MGEKGEGAVFAAAIVPRVAYCSPADGQTIMDNMKIGASSTSFAAVKTAFENTYACMNITCEEVGGIWVSAQGNYYEGAEPCPSSSGPSIQTVEIVTSASWGNIAGYPPGSQVTDHNAIGLDQKALETVLGKEPIDYTLVKNI